MVEATEILADHRWNSIHQICLCGDPTVSVDEWPAHVLSALAATHAVVELPDPDDVGEWGSVWHHSPAVGTVQARPDGSCEIRDDFEYTYTAAELSASGAALIAAARAAEASQQG